MSRLKDKPIGVFDSGIGGLTVVKALWKYLPNEAIIYLGDTARVPYGTKSKETINKFAFQAVEFLLRKKVKMIIIACHTVSSVAYDELTKKFSVPIIGVITPLAQAAFKATKNFRIGVIGTQATIASGAYESALKELDRRIEIFAKSTPLLVPLVEEGWLESAITNSILAEYLDPFRKEGIDTLLLACTHYPLLKKSIAQIFKDRVTVIDASEATAQSTQRLLTELKLSCNNRKPAAHPTRFYLTDFTPNFKEISERFLARNIKLSEIIRVSITEE